MTKETIIKAKLYHHGPSLRMRSVTIYAKKLLNSWQYFLLEGEKMHTETTMEKKNGIAFSQSAFTYSRSIMASSEK